MGRERVLTDFAKVINSDRYQYTESDIFLMEHMEEKEAIFDMYFRKTEDGGFAVVSGVQEVIELIEILNETSEEEKREYFSKIIEEKHLLEYLVKMKFTGNLYAMRDGEIVYPNEPIISIKAPLIQAKILETPILNLMNMQLAIATKASRITRAAHPIPVSSFGSRRAHGFDSAVSGTKASIIGGCLSHSNLVTEYKYGVPSVGTMAHSFIQAFGVGAAAEKKAFDTFIKYRRERKANSLILLIDTYNTLGIGLKNAIQSFKDNGIDDAFLKAQLTKDITIQNFKNNFDKNTKITEEEMKKYYDEHKKTYVDDEVRASHILISTVDPKTKKPVSDDKKKEAKKKAEEVYKKVKAGDDFAKLAKEYSDDKSSAVNGGDLGFFSKGQMVPEFEKAAFGMDKGEISDIVESQFGYHIIKVTDKKYKEYTFDEVKNNIKQNLLYKKYTEKVNELVKKAKIEKNEEEALKIRLQPY